MAFARNAEIPSREELRIACRRQAEYRFHGKAVLIRPQFVWEDLVLPEASKKFSSGHLQPKQKSGAGIWYLGIFSSRFPYGLGTSILFTGSPGTGKTMAAQVMANELDLELYRINLSAAVSKYVGETEKIST
ncbi:MAG: AAA family ATPase [Clostridiaceae bacterium]